MARHWSSWRARRVIVKVHIAPDRTGLEPRALQSTSPTIRREGAGREGERAGTSTTGHRRGPTEKRSMNAPGRMDASSGWIVSPEDADQMKDLTRFTREFGTGRAGSRSPSRTGSPPIITTRPSHVHIVIRGPITREWRTADRPEIYHARLPGAGAGNCDTGIRTEAPTGDGSGEVPGGRARSFDRD